MHLRAGTQFHPVLGHHLANASLPINTTAMTSPMHKPLCVPWGFFRVIPRKQESGKKGISSLGAPVHAAPQMVLKTLWVGFSDLLTTLVLGNTLGM